MLKEFITHTTIATTNALCFCFDQRTGGPVQGINALLVSQVAYFKKARRNKRAMLIAAY